MMSLTHDQIAQVGANWLKNNGYPISFCNMTSKTHGEQPDVLGFNAWCDTFLLEAKVSRSDFLADKKKPWRKEGGGIGSQRGYITPEGLLKAEEIPYGWWLLEVYGENKPRVRVVKGQTYEQGFSDWDKSQGRTEAKYKKRILF